MTKRSVVVQMINEKLRSIGDKLNVSKEDITDIKKRYKWERIFKIFIIPIGGILSFFLGAVTHIYIVSGGSTYPYCVAGFGTSITSSKSGKISLKLMIVGIMTWIITFFLGFLYADANKDYLGVVTYYGVYGKN